MKVSTSSWHYRLNVSQNGWVKTQARNSLCAYFWYTVFSLFKVVRGPLTAYFILWAIGFGLFSDTRFEPGPKMGLIAYPFGCIVAVILPGVVLYYLFQGTSWLGSKVRPRLRKLLGRKENKPKVKKEPGLLSSYIKARKEKICPLIQFEEK